MSPRPEGVRKWPDARMSVEGVGRGHLLEAGALRAYEAAVILIAITHEVDEPDRAAVRDDVVAYIGDHAPQAATARIRRWR